MNDKILSRKERIANATRFAPQNATQEREGLAIDELVTVNADMISLLQEDMESWKAKAEALSKLERLAREVARIRKLSKAMPDENRFIRDSVEFHRLMEIALDALAVHFAEQDKGKTE